MFGKLPISLTAVCARGNLEVGYGGRIPTVALAVGAPMKLAVVRKDRQPELLFVRVAKRVAIDELLRDDVEADALNSACGPSKTQVDDGAIETDRFENLCTLVRLKRRDPHLGEDLEHPLGNRFAVSADDAVVVRKGFRIERTEPPLLPQRLECQVGIDGVGAVTEETTVMMHLARLARFYDNPNACALLRTNQVVMHGARGKHCAHRNAIVARRSVGQHDEAEPVVDRLFGLLPDALEGGLEPFGAFAPRPSDVDDLATPSALADRLEGSDLFIREDGVRNA